jgi:hypothetical protein
MMTARVNVSAEFHFWRDNLTAADVRRTSRSMPRRRREIGHAGRHRGAIAGAVAVMEKIATAVQRHAIQFRKRCLTPFFLLGSRVDPNGAGSLPCPQQAIHGALRILPKHQLLGDHVFDRVLDHRGIHRERWIALLNRSRIVAARPTIKSGVRFPAAIRRLVHDLVIAFAQVDRLQDIEIEGGTRPSRRRSLARAGCRRSPP